MNTEFGPSTATLTMSPNRSGLCVRLALGAALLCMSCNESDGPVQSKRSQSLRDSQVVPSNATKDSSQTATLFELNSQMPTLFVEKYCKRLLDEPDFKFGSDDIVFQESSSVRVFNAMLEATFATEFIHVVRDRKRSAYVEVHSGSMQLDNAITLARKICAVTGIDQEKLQAWENREGYRSKLDHTFTAGVHADGMMHSVEIRDSFNDDNPWRVLYHIDFSLPETQPPKRE